jgi:hypothetical protein
MCKVVLEEIFLDMSISAAHYSVYQFVQSYIMLFLPLSLVGTGSVIHGGETKIWSLTLKVEHRNRMDVEEIAS